MLFRMLKVARAVHPGGSPRAWWRTFDLLARQAGAPRVRDWYGEGHPALREALAWRPSLVALDRRPYICLRWNAERRIAAVEDHYRQLEGRASVLRAAALAPVRLATVAAREAAVDVVVDSPAWFMHEGEASINLFSGGQRLYTLAFSLGVDDGQRVAYIGALQGHGSDDALEIYRKLTHGLHGLRPRDLLLAAFRALCRALGVTRIFAVDDRHRVCESAYFQAARKVASSYDAIWQEQRGTGRQDGFFELPIGVQRRPAESISSNKRAEYRRRYALLDQLGADIALGVHRGGAP